MVCVLLGIALPARMDASDALAAAICGILRKHVPEVAAAKKPRGDWRLQLARKAFK
jgi:hypothetical protein